MSTVDLEPAAIGDQADDEDLRRARTDRLMRKARWILPLGFLALALGGWELVCVLNEIPHYILPAPSRVIWTLFAEWQLLFQALLNTLKIMALSLLLAVVGGVGLAVIFSQSRVIEMSLFPFAVILQVTPIVAIFPLINIYVEDHTSKLLLCAWIVAFFPILANTTLGLNSVDQNLRDLFKMNGASRWQTLRRLELPAAMPYFLGGLRIAGGLALIGAVVAEFVAGSSGLSSGLASQIVESGYRLKIPRLFAALVLISFTGIVIYFTLSLISHLALRKWHESALGRER